MWLPYIEGRLYYHDTIKRHPKQWSGWVHGDLSENGDFSCRWSKGRARLYKTITGSISNPGIVNSISNTATILFLIMYRWMCWLVVLKHSKIYILAPLWLNSVLNPASRKKWTGTACGGINEFACICPYQVLWNWGRRGGQAYQASTLEELTKHVSWNVFKYTHTVPLNRNCAHFVLATCRCYVK